MTKIDLFHKAQMMSVPMVCQKIMAKMNNKKMVLRSCQFDSEKSDTCDIYKSKAGKKGIEIEHCSLCTSDKCNHCTQVMLTRSLKVATGLSLMYLNFIRAIMYWSKGFEYDWIIFLVCENEN